MKLYAAYVVQCSAVQCSTRLGRHQSRLGNPTKQHSKDVPGLVPPWIGCRGAIALASLSKHYNRAYCIVNASLVLPGGILQLPALGACGVPSRQ